MKQIILIAVFLLFSLTSFAQKTFVRKYSHYKISQETEAKVGTSTFVINDNDITVYVKDKKVRTLHPITEPKEGETYNGSSFQYIECVDDRGTRVIFQIFDSSVRLIFAAGFSIDYF